MRTINLSMSVFCCPLSVVCCRRRSNKFIKKLFSVGVAWELGGKEGGGFGHKNVIDKNVRALLLK